MPDLNLAYDEQADKLNKSTLEIDNYIKKLEIQLRMEAGRKYLKEIYEEQIRLQLQLKEKKRGSNGSRSRMVRRNHKTCARITRTK